MARHPILYWLMGSGQWFAWMVTDLEETRSEYWKQGSLVDQDICRRGMWIDLSEWGEKCDDICVPRKCSPKGSFSREDFNNEVDRMICSVDSSQVSFSSQPRQHSVGHEQSGHGGREGYVWAQPRGLLVTKADLAMLTKCPICTNTLCPIWQQSPGWSASYMVVGWLHGTTSITEGAMFHSN